MSRQIRLIIPAAGNGTRIDNPSVPKTLTQVNGRPIITHILDAVDQFVDEIVIVASPTGGYLIDAVVGARAKRSSIAIQSAPIGMADAVQIGLNHWTSHEDADYIIIWGDQVTVSHDTVSEALKLYNEWLPKGRHVLIPICMRMNPYTSFEYGVREDSIIVLEKHEGDGMPPMGANDIGIFIIDGVVLEEILKLLFVSTFNKRTGIFQRTRGRKSITGEFNFLPIFEFIPLSALTFYYVNDEWQTIGVNTKDDVARIEEAGRCM